MKISFVVPARNEEDYLGNCLDSILREIHSEGCTAEVIVVDNASTDRTSEVAQSYPTVRVIGEQRKGANWARQTGFAASCGELIANVDADVILPEGWLSAVLHEFNNDARLAALTGPCIYHDVSRAARLAVKVFYLGGLALHYFNQHVLGIGAMAQGGNCVIRREALTSIGGYNTAITFFGDDTDLACRLQKQGTVRWTFRLPVYTSGRRFKGEGLLYTGAIYAINFFAVTYWGAPLSYQYSDVREGERFE